MFFDFLNPLLSLPTLWVVVILSFLVSLVSTLSYRYLTDQALMKTLRADMKKAQEDMKKLKENPAAMLKKQKAIMEKNMMYMQQSFKPMLFTFLPIILVFAWMAAHLAAEPLMVGVPFTITAQFDSYVYGTVDVASGDGIVYTGVANQTVTAKEIAFPFTAVQAGTWNVTFSVVNKTYTVPVAIGEDALEPQIKTSGAIKKITVSYPKRIVLDIFGFQMGWLITYIIFSLIFSISLRKIFGVS